MEKLKHLLEEGHHSLVVENREEGKAYHGIHTFDDRGISNLYKLLNERPDILKGARVADKIVGKAAAALMILGGVSELYAAVISQKALELLSQYGVRVTSSVTVSQIYNRQLSGPCPMEICCANCLTPAECLTELERKLACAIPEKRHLSK